jgi:hypothetical protein
MYYAFIIWSPNAPILLFLGFFFFDLHRHQCICRRDDILLVPLWRSDAVLSCDLQRQLTDSRPQGFFFRNDGPDTPSLAVFIALRYRWHMDDQPSSIRYRWRSASQPSFITYVPNFRDIKLLIFYATGILPT